MKTEKLHFAEISMLVVDLRIYKAAYFYNSNK